MNFQFFFHNRNKLVKLNPNYEEKTEKKVDNFVLFKTEHPSCAQSKNYYYFRNWRVSIRSSRGPNPRIERSGRNFGREGTHQIGKNTGIFVLGFSVIFINFRQYFLGFSTIS